jgi:hypothetical protein
MVDFKKLTDKAKDLVDKRGGTDALKEDAVELKDIATGEGSLADKAKAAAEVLKDAGAADGADEPNPVAAEPTEPIGVAEERAQRRARRAERRKERAERRRGGQDPA